MLEVRAKFDEDSGISGILNETEAYVTSAYSDAELTAAGLPADALGFDFGLESDNQEDFAALGVAGLIEGFVTGRPWPTSIRVGIGAIAFLAFWGWTIVYGRRADQILIDEKAAEALTRRSVMRP